MTAYSFNPTRLPNRIEKLPYPLQLCRTFWGSEGLGIYEYQPNPASECLPNKLDWDDVIVVWHQIQESKDFWVCGISVWVQSLGFGVAQGLLERLQNNILHFTRRGGGGGLRFCIHGFVESKH